MGLFLPLGTVCFKFVPIASHISFHACTYLLSTGVVTCNYLAIPKRGTLCSFYVTRVSSHGTIINVIIQE